MCTMHSQPGLVYLPAIDRASYPVVTQLGPITRFPLVKLEFKLPDDTTEVPPVSSQLPGPARLHP